MYSKKQLIHAIFTSQLLHSHHLYKIQNILKQLLLLHIHPLVLFYILKWLHRLYSVPTTAMSLTAWITSLTSQLQELSNFHLQNNLKITELYPYPFYSHTSKLESCITHQSLLYLQPTDLQNWFLNQLTLPKITWPLILPEKHLNLYILH